MRTALLFFGAAQVSPPSQCIQPIEYNSHFTHSCPLSSCFLLSLIHTDWSQLCKTTDTLTKTGYCISVYQWFQHVTAVTPNTHDTCKVIHHLKDYKGLSLIRCWMLACFFLSAYSFCVFGFNKLWKKLNLVSLFYVPQHWDTAVWLWIIPTHWVHGRWVAFHGWPPK